MNSVERVKAICKERKIPLSRLEKDLGFANGYIGQLKKGFFPDDRLRKIADYLNVSAEFLVTGNESPSDSIISELDGAYLSLAKEAQEKGISPDDLRTIMQAVQKLRG